MTKVAFLGAGSTIFAKNLIGDILLSEALRDSEIALYDIDDQRLRDTLRVVETLNRTIPDSRAGFTVHHGPEERREALRGADFVIHAVQVGGYEPSTIIDFDIPKKYGLHQTIGDTLGIGGIFRALRTIPVVLEFALDMEENCPDAWFLNYVNPMAMVTGALLEATPIRTVGLCHSVQVCAEELLSGVGMEKPQDLRCKIAGINHQAWLLEIADGRRDLYPEIRRLAAEKNEKGPHSDAVRFEIMRLFGHYVTESSEHNAEYVPWFIHKNQPDLIDRFAIPLDEYPRRCVSQMEKWEEEREKLLELSECPHERTREYGSAIMEAIQTDVPARVHGNISNDGLITNLPDRAVVEVPCLVDRNGIQGCAVGDLPEGCAALNRNMINVQLLAIDAALQQKRDLLYQAALLDPHTAAELSTDEIVSLCDDLIEAHGEMLPDLL